MTDFMNELASVIAEKNKILPATANTYVRMMYTLNDKKGFGRIGLLMLLKKTDEIEKRLSKYEESTKGSFYKAISAVTSVLSGEPFKRVHNYYYEKMMNKRKELNEKNTGDKNEKQKENWVDWEDVLTQKRKLQKQVEKVIKSDKALTEEQYKKLLQLLILSLYTDIPPRRNQDYLNMYVVKEWNDELPKTRNYLDLSTNNLIFNKYKTAKTYGSQVFQCPPELLHVIDMFNDYTHIGGDDTKDHYKLLRDPNGIPITAVNAITYILNDFFGKNVGTSMLRHSYLSSKYVNTKDELVADAKAMGHSIMAQQSEYVRR